MTDERRRNMTMIYGSLAYDLDSMVRERQLEEAGDMRPSAPAPQPKAQRRPQVQAKARPSALLLGGIVVIAALVLLLLLGYVQLTTVSNHVVTIKQELTALEDEHVSLLTEYEKTFDLATVKAAAEEAGMSKPTSGQIQYIDLSGADAAVVYADEPGIIEKTVTTLKSSARSLWEYFR